MRETASQDRAKVRSKTTAGVVTCAIGVVAVVTARGIVPLAAEWIASGLVVLPFLAAARYFFLAARKTEHNARNLRVLMEATEAALEELNATGDRRQADEVIHQVLARAAAEARFDSTHASPRERTIRAEAIDLLGQAVVGAARAGAPGRASYPAPRRMEFEGQVEPGHYVIVVDGIQVVFNRAPYLLLLAMALRRKLRGEDPPRDDDPGSFHPIGDRRDHVAAIETFFRDRLQRQVIDDGGKGRKLRRLNCNSDDIAIDARRHLADRAIASDPEVHQLLKAVAVGSP